MAWGTWGIGTNVNVYVADQIDQMKHNVKKILDLQSRNLICFNPVSAGVSAASAFYSLDALFNGLVLGTWNVTSVSCTMP